MINKILQFLGKYRQVVPTILATLSAVTLYLLTIQFFDRSYSVLLLSVLPLYWFYSSVKPNRDRGILISSVLLSLFFTGIIFLATGLYDERVNLIIGKIEFIISIFGLFLLLFYSFNIFLTKAVVYDNFNRNPRKEKKFFFMIWLTFLVAWLPYLGAFFPSIMSPDSIDQWIQATGIVGLFNHHPIAHTLLIRYTIFFTGNNPLGYTLFQMLALSLMITVIIYWMYKKGLNSFWFYLAIIFFAFLPIHGVYSVTMWKDVVFAIIMSFFTLIIAEILTTKKANLRPYFLLGISALMVMFFRNNGVYVILPMAGLLILFIKENRLKITIAMLSALLIYFAVTGPLFTFYKIKKSSLTESLGIPIQQVSRVVFESGKISAEDKMLIGKVIPVSEIKEHYTTVGVDPIKFNPEFKISAIGENKGDYLKLWLRLMRDNPRLYATAYLDATRGFWDPLARNWSTYFDIYENKYGLYQENLSPTLRQFLINFSERVQWPPPVSLLWSGAFYNYLMLIGGVVMILRKKAKYLLVIAPAFLNWATLLVATPISTSTRYIYSSFLIFPIIIFLSVYDDTSHKQPKPLK